ncbi:DNA cytosine methyltransferase [Mucilaginibacter sp. CAU 1740]|uniref:DNA cytosine methyltransferase n=1 Tax=Mucilaginibacter sp. CAU 1740 TaxID=3140365 RepID=UPI00325B0122
MPFPIIDLFAGPGGLAEGFSSLTGNDNDRIFKIELSIEKDSHAHQTLTLRSFVRQFPFRELPDEYYAFLRQEITIEDLYQAWPEQHHKAMREAWQATLGETSEAEVDRRIAEKLDGETNWVLIGGPPCQAYSLVGRSRVGGISETDHRVHLYKEYLRIIARHQPAVFVMENVKGLLSAELNGEKIFSKIMADLTTPAIVFPEYAPPGYRIYSLVKDNVRTDGDYLIRSEDYGVPQKRHRVILLGVREDIDVVPGTLEPSRKTDLKSVIGALPALRSGIYREFTHTEIVNTEKGTKKARKYQNLDDSFEGWSERISSYTEELLSTFSELGYNAKFEQTLPESTGSDYRRTPRTISQAHPLSRWYSDEKLDGVLQHQSRGHLTQDLKRYLFAALYTREFKKFPRMDDYRKFGTDLIPDHENAESGKFNDRFRVQLPDEPATTVTSHISKDGHYFIHYDPSQCRSLTVREAARIQTFPDNYWFCGSRTQQFHQVGNAVPPYLAWQIASVVHEILVPENAREVREPVLFRY